MKNKLVVYIEHNRLLLAGSNLQEISAIDVPQDILADQEILQRAKLQELIRSFLINNKIEQADIALIFSPIFCFEKDIAISDPQVGKAEKNTFLEVVPFEAVASTELPIENGYRVIGVNKDLLDTLQQAIRGTDFKFVLAIPQIALHQYGIDNSIPFNLDMMAAVIKNWDGLHRVNLLPNNQPPEEIETPSPQVGEQSTISPKNSHARLIIMAGVFIVLLVVLGFMILG